MNALIISCRNILLMTVFLGGIYPLVVTIVGKTIFNHQSHGSLVMKDNKVVGSELLAQKFTKEEYFWSRPSAVDYAANGGGASNKSATSKDLKDAVMAREITFGKGAPMDLLYASGSGLDPHISLGAAKFQQERVRIKRNMSQEEMDKLVAQASEGRFLGFMGHPRVNVLKLNMLLDQHYKP